MKILLDEHKLDPVFVNVTLKDGNVRLWGVIENADEAAAAEAAAKTVVPTKNLVRGGADAAMGYLLPGCSTS